jgi:putative DNA primase/helicase
VVPVDDPIDFGRLAQALLDGIDQLLPMWLPGGGRNGREYQCADLSGGKGTSLSVNVHTGAWADFATDDKGGDLISLYAAIHGMNNGKAARTLMESLGWQQPAARPVHRPGPSPAPAAVPAQQKEGGKAEEAKRTTWRPIVPVPEHAPKAELKHYQRGQPSASWAYMREGQLLGHVARYPTSDGGKDIVPWTWCIDDGDPRGLCRWHMKQWEDPRPLFLASGLSPVKDRLVLVVEGEKCAAAAHGALPELQAVSWPGGGKAWDKAGWGDLAGCAVVLWADCDAKRVKLTRAEREAGVDEATKPLLPEDKQPGIMTMRAIGAHLVSLGCVVTICPLPAPGAVADGWDIADAIDQGWAPDQLRAFLAAAVPFAPVGEAEQADQPLPAAGAGKRWKREGTWQANLSLTEKGAVKACRENVVMGLDGLPSDDIPGIPDAVGIIAFNEFTNNVEKLRRTPWGTAAGEWLEEDELEMGNWLVHKHFMPPMPRTALEEAVKMVAGRHRYHPVRTYLETLRGKWDGQRRLAGWLKRVCKAQSPDGLEDSTGQYLARVGSWLVMAMVARVMAPGCKFDYMVIFEGPQGVGKSTLARVLGGDWFADTGLVMGDKDAYQNLQGVWVYEIGELDSFSKAEVTKVKAFASSQKDRFRASFDRRPRDYPRQVVFVGTTNEDHYLTDPTGNRRFWPVRVGGPIDIAWVREHRDRLFAEALHAFEAGHRFHPTQDEQRELFDLQQNARTVELPIESRIVSYLYDDDQKVPLGQANGAYVNEITTSELLSRIGIGIEKQVSAPALVKQANAILKKYGWKPGKSSAKGGRERVNVFKRPPSAGTPTAPVQGHEPAELEDECPF